MTAKYFNGLAGIREEIKKICLICIYANEAGDIAQIECQCEESDHYCHVLVAWHPACDAHKQGRKPENVGANNHSPVKRKPGRPRKKPIGEDHASI